MGAKTYFTGRSCPDGHIALRYTSNGACVDCLAVRTYETYTEYKLTSPAPRTCSKCGTVHDKRQCPECRARWIREHPLSPDRRKELAAQQRARLAERRAFIRQVKQEPCTDCGGRFPWYVTEFDHRDGRGDGPTIAQMTSASLVRLREEMAKCDLVCANCHRVRTHMRAVEAGERYP